MNPRGPAGPRVDGVEAPANKVPVWDASIRIFHWSLVALVATAWISGGSGERLHEIVGCAAAGLILFRLIWGFFGSPHARFRDFVPGPSRLAGYVRSVLQGRPAHHLGHNPAGAAMILMLIAVLATLAISGLMMQSSRFFGVEWVERIHGLAANSLLVLVPLHVLGALLSSVLHRENLVWAMFTGHKPATHGRAPPTLREQFEFRLKGVEGLFPLAVLGVAGAAYGLVTTAGRSEATAPAQAELAAPVQAPAQPPQAVAAAPVTTVMAVAAVTPPAVAQDEANGAPKAALLQEPEQPSRLWILSFGGQLYDNWYAVQGKSGPSATHPSWPAANTTLQGADTWRCTSCHGWDYLGRDGQLAAGPGATGIRGVQRLRGHAIEDIVAILESPTHRYTDDLIPGKAKRMLAAFISLGQGKAQPSPDAKGMPRGDTVNGRNLFQTLCAGCHGFDGRSLKLGVGAMARQAPQAVLHKSRNGHPGSRMISLRGLGPQAANDILAYAQTLPAP